MDASDAADMAKDEAQKAYDRAQTAKNESESSRDNLIDLISRFRDFLTQSGARPADIRAVGLVLSILFLSIVFVSVSWKVEGGIEIE